MIAPPPGVRILIATRPVDFRKGADGLAALAMETLGQNPFSGTVLVFRGKRADRIKILMWDGTGLILFWKRLEKSVFKWPKISDGMMRLSPAQLSALIEGLDWSRVHTVRVTTPQIPG
jgi:transposase